MKRVIGYILTPIFYLIFGFILIVFHPIQVICYNLGGYSAHKRSVDIMNYLLIKTLIILGSRTKFIGFDQLPKNKPLIIIANHQSMFDIPPVVWGFRKHHAKFISKKELGKGIPSISYNLRKGGSVLIDRKNPKQAINEIKKLGDKIEENNYSALIFPEGTRSKNGQMRKFKAGGIHALLEKVPSAYIVPFVIDGHYKLQENGSFPLGIGNRLTYKVLPPFKAEGMNSEEVTEKTELLIREELNQV